MYQFSTVSPLASSKRYFNTPQECAQHLKECVKITEEFLVSRNLKPLSKAKIVAGQRLIKLDFSQEPYLRKILGDEKPIMTEYLQQDLDAETRRKESLRKRKEKKRLKCLAKQNETIVVGVK